MKTYNKEPTCQKPIISIQINYLFYKIIFIINKGLLFWVWKSISGIFHPPQKKSTLRVYWFLRFFPPSTSHLLELCISFFHKIPPSTFIPTSTFTDLAYFAPPPRLFQPSRLLERWEYNKSILVRNLLFLSKYITGFIRLFLS